MLVDHLKKCETINVLIVDDDEADVLLIKRSLEQSERHFFVHSEPTGEHALTYLDQVGDSSSCPDVVILDLNMPGKSGHEVLQQIRLDPRFASLPVVILTTSENPTDRELAFEQHAQCFATKPSRLDEYDMLVESIFAFWRAMQGSEEESTG